MPDTVFPRHADCASDNRTFRFMTTALPCDGALVILTMGKDPE
jgi:hypothetical protein